MQKGQVKLKEMASARRHENWKPEEKRQHANGSRIKRVKGEETEWKRQSAVTVKNNWNSLMRFALVTIKFSGLLAY